MRPGHFILPRMLHRVYGEWGNRRLVGAVVLALIL